MRFKPLLVIVAVLTLVSGSVLVGAITIEKDKAATITSNLEGLQALPGVIKSLKSPTIKTPGWLQVELDAEAAAAAKVQQTYLAAPGSNGIVTYDVTTEGTITANLTEFKSLANQTLNDERGWPRLGVSFQEVASGGDFTLVLSNANQVPSFYPSVCSIYWSCQVGRYVIINQDRWLGASDSWNQARGSLRNYRNMVINHETGHWLGHLDDNSHCGGAGQAAPIMQQQSISLLGCSFNPWPLNFELWSSRLGI